MKDYAEGFYKSTAWKECRKSYIKSVGGLCEDCLSKGLFRSGEIVHHIIHITPENINDPNITLSWNNLRYVCRECHGKEHRTHGKRYTVDVFGVVTMEEE